MDPGRAPLRVFLAHPLNEITQATIDLRAPCPLSRFPAPESFEAHAMPSQDGLELGAIQGLAPLDTLARDTAAAILHVSARR